jgi:hypothetical protein
MRYRSIQPDLQDTIAHDGTGRHARYLCTLFGRRTVLVGRSQPPMARGTLRSLGREGDGVDTP